MKNLLKTVFALLLIMIFCSAFTKKEKESKPVYIFGFSASFLDTTAYFTDIQKLDSIKLEDGFLPERSAYSYQLKNFLELKEGLPNRTCAVYYSENKKKLEKEASKLKSKYLKNKINCNSVGSDKFKFKRMVSE